MNELGAALVTALSLIASFDADLVEIVGLSLRVSLAAVALAAVIGLPLGAAVALFRFPGRGAVSVLLNALMGLPPVVVGLVVYLMLSRAGPLGVFGLLFTPAAMIAAQCLLIAPIIAALTRQVVADLWEEYAEQLRSLGAGPGRAVPTLLWDGRFTLVTVIFAGFGRAMGEDRLHAPGGGEQGKSAQERIDEIHSWQHSDDPALCEKYKSDPVQAELRGLYQQLEGSKPIVGAGGRTL